MKIYLRGSRWWTRVRGSDHRLVRVPTGTHDRPTALQMARMTDLLIGQREWPILDAIVTDRLSLAEAWDSWRRDPSLRTLLDSLRDVDLSAYVDGWERWVAPNVTAQTLARYRRAVRLLVPEKGATPRSTVTVRHMTDTLADHFGGQPAGAQYARAGWVSFFDYLLLAEAVTDNLARRVANPPAPKSRERWITIADSMRLVDAQPEPFNIIAALREGACAETQAALSLRRGDCDSTNRTVHLHGTKNRFRDRIARVDHWAWERIGPFIDSRGDGDPLFPGVTYKQVVKQHHLACGRLGITNYRPHDARHSYCVRHFKAGTRIELVAHNGGWRDATMPLSIYGKYRVLPGDYAETDTSWR